MSILRREKLYFSDSEQSDLASAKHWKPKKLLSKIEETSEIASDLMTVTEILDSQYLHTQSIKNPSLSSRSTFFLSFLQKLSKHPKIFTMFALQVLGKSMKSPKKNKKFKVRLNQSVKTVKKILDSDLESSIGDSVVSCETLKKPATIRKGMLFTNNWRFEKKKKDVPQTASSSGSSVLRTGASVVTNIRSFRRRMTLNTADPELIKIYKKISQDRHKISNDDFKNFLSTRYPVLVAETMSKAFSFKYSNIEEYAIEMNKFILMGEERHLNFCFEIFDFNKDKKINYQDTFKAMEIRTGNHYDDDLVLIQEMFDIKNSGMLKPNKGKQNRRKSTFSLINDEKKKKEDEEIEKKIDKKKFHKNASINYTEFCMIKFNVRPQILQDFLKFTCNYDYLMEKGYVQRPPSHKGKESEHIVVDMNLNPEYAESLMKSDKYEYYCALDSAMLLFKKPQLEDLLKKFKFLQSDDRLRLKVITKQSMVDKLPGLLGYNHPYLSERFYECLSQGKDLTKALFLSKVHSLLSNTNQLTINKLSFDMIDSRNDNKLSVDEVYNIFESLPSRSKVYQEVLIIINMYIQSIFERVREKLNFIDFYRYTEIINESVLGLEFVDMLQSPIEKCINRKTLYFEPLDSIPEDLDTKKLTLSSLQSM